MVRGIARAGDVLSQLGWVQFDGITITVPASQGLAVENWGKGLNALFGLAEEIVREVVKWSIIINVSEPFKATRIYIPFIAIFINNSNKNTA